MRPRMYPVNEPTNEADMVMDPLETARIRQRIERRLDQLRGEITGKLGDAALVTEALGGNADSGDLSVADDTMTTDFADARRDLFEYHTGIAALARLDAGDYGTCVDCSEPIPERRLLAQPFAVRCLGCQERAERASGMVRPTM
jgi:DnaK suppressor protein